MNFFEAQDDARRRTQWLFVCFVLAIIGIVFSVYGLACILLIYNGNLKTLWMPQVFLITSCVTAGIVGIGSLFKILQLNGGGSVVARDMGARRVDHNSTHPDESRLVNIVEEMAIASGVPVPEVWVMEEESSINAFAAGTEPGNAVVAVTRGCLQRLTREELQGVVAHEFSHILNGDMRLNVRLMGLLFGVLMISMIGRSLFKALRFVNVRGSRNDHGGGLAVVVAIALAGVGFLIVGSVGVFFGRLIQAAISRQREYLADASAVQFTRNPSGISGALKKIGGQAASSGMQAVKAAEASHLFFADGGMFSYGLATHPPLAKRIRVIEQSWDGKFLKSALPNVAGKRVGRRLHRNDHVSGLNTETAVGVKGDDQVPAQHSVSASQFDTLGHSEQVQLSIGSTLHRALAQEWIDACHVRENAQALMLGLLMAVDEELRAGEVEFIQKNAGDDTASLALMWHQNLVGLHSSKKIALIDLCIPTLRRLSRPEYERFVKITQWLISSDGQVDLFEFMLQHIIQKHLDSHFMHAGCPRIRYRSISRLQSESEMILSALAGLDDRREKRAEAYSAAVREMNWQENRMPDGSWSFEDLKRVLNKLNQATPLVKQQLLRMCGLAVMHDGEVDSREAELLRTIADAVGCPIPPFVKDSPRV